MHQNGCTTVLRRVTATRTRWCSWKTPDTSSSGCAAPRSNPVVYAELPGAQHTFDLFHSLRFAAVVDAIEAFASWVRTNVRQAAPDQR